MTSAPGQVARINALHDRVTALEADLGAREVLARYGHFVDTWHDREFVDLFTRDGVYEFSDPAAPVAGLNRLTGHSELLAHVTNPSGHHDPARHGTEMYLQGLNCTTDVVDHEHVEVVSSSVVVRTSAEGLRLHAAGSSRWWLRADAHRWRIEMRRRQGLGEATFADDI